MKRTVCVGLMCFLGYCLPAGADQPTPYEIKQVRKEPVVMDVAKHPRMHVLFDHQKHNGISCFTCHHKPVDGFALVSCTTAGCHTDIDRKSRAAGSYFQAIHRKDNAHSCVGCHTLKAAEKPGLADCQTCHDASRLLKASATNR